MGNILQTLLGGKSLPISRLQKGNKVQHTPYIQPDDYPEQYVYDPSQYITLEERVPSAYIRQYDLSKTPIEERTTATYQQAVGTIPPPIVDSPIIDVDDDTITLKDIKHATHMDNINTIANKLKKENFTKEQIAAILASVIGESGGDNLAIGDKGTARGIMQWRGDRWKAGNDLDSQVELLINEIRSNSAWGKTNAYSRENALSAFAGTDLYNMVRAMTYNYVRPANAERDTTKRYQIAQQIYNQLK